MNTLFQNILTASFHGSIVILAVMLLRLVLKKTPRKYICLLWLLAGLRLLMPFQIQSDLSLQPSADPVAQVQQLSHSQTPAAPEDFSPADLDVPAPVQTAMVAALGDQRHVDEQRARYAARRARMRAALERAGFRIDHSEGSLYLWATQDGPGRESIDWLAGRGILAAPGDFYGPHATDHVRISMTATDERIAAAVDRLTA